MKSWTPLRSHIDLDSFLLSALKLAKQEPLTHERVADVLKHCSFKWPDWTIEELAIFSLDVNFWLNRIKTRLMRAFKPEQFKVVACEFPPYQIHIKGHGEALYVIKVDRDGTLELTYECSQQGCTVWAGDYDEIDNMLLHMIAFELRSN